MKRFAVFLFALLCTTFASGNAFADTTTYNFVFLSQDINVGGMGTITATPTANPAQFLISQITGQVQFGATTYDILSLLPPGSYPVTAQPSDSNDNLLMPFDLDLLDYSGVSFKLNDGTAVNLYGIGGGTYYGQTDGTGFSVEFALDMPVATAATPEPSTIALLGTGVVSAAGMMRYRRSNLQRTDNVATTDCQLS